MVQFWLRPSVVCNVCLCYFVLTTYSNLITDVISNGYIADPLYGHCFPKTYGSTPDFRPQEMHFARQYGQLNLGYPSDSWVLVSVKFVWPRPPT